MKSRNDSQSLLEALPKDVKNSIPLDPSSVINLARTGRHFYALFTLSGAYQRALSSLNKLLNHAALGELEAAEKILKLFPDLLTYRGTIYHPNRVYVKGLPPVAIPFHQNPGRYKYMNRTSYQILLMNSEFEEAEKVGKLMTQEEKQKQFNEVFPDGQIKKYNFDLKEAKKLLLAVCEAMAKDECLKIERDEHYIIKNIIMSDSTREALHQLYRYTRPKLEHEIGLVFDPEFYHEALKLYKEKFDHHFKQRWDRYAFWNICVEEWLVGCLGTRFLRPRIQGLDNSLTRRGCVLMDGSSVFSFRRTTNSFPRFYSFVGHNSNSTHVGFGRGEVASGVRVNFEEYVKQQREKGQPLYGNLQHAAKPPA